VSRNPGNLGEVKDIYPIPMGNAFFFLLKGVTVYFHRHFHSSRATRRQ
jgi:hypothetical protein